MNNKNRLPWFLFNETMKINFVVFAQNLYFRLLEVFEKAKVGYFPIRLVACPVKNSTNMH